MPDAPSTFRYKRVLLKVSGEVLLEGRNLLTLPEETIVRTGHGDHTTIGNEAPHLEEWIRRGY